MICAATHAREPDRPRQAAPDSRLCHGCIQGMARHLVQLPGLYQDVVDAIPAGWGGGGGPAVSGSRTPRLPYNPAAGECASQIAHDVEYWARLVASERRLVGPRGDVPDQCAWLAGHVGWLASGPHAEVVRSVLAELMSRALRVLTPRRAPILLGPCLERACDGTLRASMAVMDAPARIWCDACPFEAGMRDWWALGQTYHQIRAVA